MLQKNNLKHYIENNYKGIIIDYNIVDKKITETKLKIYKNKNKLKEEDEVNIKDIINLSSICSSISSQIKKYYSRNNTIHK